LRAVVGDIILDDVLSQRDRINELIRTRLDHETERWGVKVTNVEIRELTVPPEIQEAMNRQMSAERVRRAVVLEAEGQRQAAILNAEGLAKALTTISAEAKKVDPNTMGLQYLDAIKKLAEGPASKFFFPLELTSLVEQFAPGKAKS
jgi:regulator of protease activity HflC (stomatin/prohibitin superfamily)